MPFHPSSSFLMGSHYNLYNTSARRIVPNRIIVRTCPYRNAVEAQNTVEANQHHKNFLNHTFCHSHCSVLTRKRSASSFMCWEICRFYRKSLNHKYFRHYFQDYLYLHKIITLQSSESILLAHVNYRPQV